jgi:hypothetical protein
VLHKSGPLCPKQGRHNSIGVRYRHGSYYCQLWYKRAAHYLGSYRSHEEAACVHDAAAIWRQLQDAGELDRMRRRRGGQVLAAVGVVVLVARALTTQGSQSSTGQYDLLPLSSSVSRNNCNTFHRPRPKIAAMQLQPLATLPSPAHQGTIYSLARQNGRKASQDHSIAASTLIHSSLRLRSSHFMQGSLAMHPGPTTCPSCAWPATSPSSTGCEP